MPIFFALPVQSQFQKKQGTFPLSDHLLNNEYDIIEYINICFYSITKLPCPIKCRPKAQATFFHRNGECIEFPAVAFHPQCISSGDRCHMTSPPVILESSSWSTHVCSEPSLKSSSKRPRDGSSAMLECVGTLAK